MEFYWRGGAERVLDMIAGELRARHDIALFTLSFAKDDYETLNDLERHEIKGRSSLRGRLTKYYETKKYADLVRQVNAWSPDVILVNKDFQYVRWIASRTRKPIVLYLHGVLDVLNFPKPSAKLRKEKRNFVSALYRRKFDPRGIPSLDLSSAEALICVSHSSERVIREFFNGEIRVVYNAVNHQWFEPTWEDKNYALCISRFSPEKNLEFLMRALGDAKYPVVIHGTVGTGESGAQGVKYLEQLKASRPGNFKIVTHTDDLSMKRLLQECSVFLHPGRNEGFPLLPLEAMACGKPVIAHNSGGTPECVNGAGILLGDDPIEWRGKVDELMNARELREQWGKKAYEYSRGYTWERTARGVEEVLSSVASQRES
jgi:glycosyltransferase involved in cell wall biosynthesis